MMRAGQAMSPGDALGAADLAAPNLSPEKDTRV
jgi:hypothetical protein